MLDRFGNALLDPADDQLGLRVRFDAKRKNDELITVQVRQEVVLALGGSMRLVDKLVGQRILLSMSSRIRNGATATWGINSRVVGALLGALIPAPLLATDWGGPTGLAATAMAVGAVLGYLVTARVVTRHPWRLAFGMGLAAVLLGAIAQATLLSLQIVARTPGDNPDQSATVGALAFIPVSLIIGLVVFGWLFLILATAAVAIWVAIMRRLCSRLAPPGPKVPFLVHRHPIMAALVVLVIAATPVAVLGAARPTTPGLTDRCVNVPGQSVTGVGWSADGSWLAVASDAVDGGLSEFSRIDLPTGSPKTLFTTQGRVSAGPTVAGDGAVFWVESTPPYPGGDSQVWFSHGASATRVATLAQLDVRSIVATDRGVYLLVNPSIGIGAMATIVLLAPGASSPTEPLAVALPFTMAASRDGNTLAWSLGGSFGVGSAAGMLDVRRDGSTRDYPDAGDWTPFGVGLANDGQTLLSLDWSPGLPVGDGNNQNVLTARRLAGGPAWELGSGFGPALAVSSTNVVAFVRDFTPSASLVCWTHPLELSQPAVIPSAGP